MRFMTPSAAVVALIKKDGERVRILLQKRQNTGFADGMWDLSCSGHVEDGESISQAAVRECGEELGVTVREEDLKFFAFIHKRDGEVTYYNAYFSAEKFSGVPRIKETWKCQDLQWFYLDELPKDLLDDRKTALNSLLCDAEYYAYGWDIVEKNK